MIQVNAVYIFFTEEFMFSFCVPFSERFSAHSSKPQLVMQHKSGNRSSDRFDKPLSSSFFNPKTAVAKNCETERSMSQTSIMRMAVAHHVVDEKIGACRHHNEFEYPGD